MPLVSLEPDLEIGCGLLEAHSARERLVLGFHTQFPEPTLVNGSMLGESQTSELMAM